MSSSFSCEEELMKLADELHKQAYDLEKATETLRILRNSQEIQDRIKAAKEWAKKWMER